MDKTKQLLFINGLMISLFYLLSLSSLYAFDLLHTKVIFAISFSYLCCLAVCSYILYRFFHKALGPLQRLENYFVEVSAKREVLPLSFRKDDYFQQLPPLIIETLQSFEQKEKDYLQAS